MRIYHHPFVELILMLQQLHIVEDFIIRLIDCYSPFDGVSIRRERCQNEDQNDDDGNDKQDGSNGSHISVVYEYKITLTTPQLR
jgi:hypothetical protein